MSVATSTKCYVTFIDNEDVRHSSKALSMTFDCFRGYTGYWLFRFIPKTNELLYFFPVSCISKLGDEKSKFYEALKKNWEHEGFEIVEEEKLSSSEVYEVSIPSLLFRIRKKA